MEIQLNMPKPDGTAEQKLTTLVNQKPLWKITTAIADFFLDILRYRRDPKKNVLQWCVTRSGGSNTTFWPVECKWHQKIICDVVCTLVKIGGEYKQPALSTTRNVHRSFLLWLWARRDIAIRFARWMTSHNKTFLICGNDCWTTNYFW